MRLIPRLPLLLIAIAATAMPVLAADDDPFWTGSPDPTTFTRTHQGRLEKAKAAVEAVLAVKGARTVENTLAPYDQALTQLDAASSQCGLMEAVHPDSGLRAAAEKMTQEVSAYATELSLNRRVYEALKAIDVKNADAETRFYVQHELRDFRLAGVDKDDATRKRIKELRDELVKIGQEFDRNIREGVRSIEVDPADLEGLPSDYVEGHKPGANGKVTINTNYPDFFPVMSYAKKDDVRRRLYMEYQNRAFPKNTEVLNRLIARRGELAKILGYPNWADYITANKMSGSRKTVREFIDKVVAASNTRAEREYEQLLQRKKKDDPAATAVNFWEFPYYAEQVQKSDYNFDSQTVRPYFAYPTVKQGVLDLTSRLFGVEFKKVENAPVWHPSVECYEMFEDGKRVARFYLDMHPRANKFNHAAEFDVRTGIAGKQIPEATLVCNLPGEDPNDPGLMEHSDMTTFLHEFGHLLHTLFAGRHAWVGIGGIRTEWDFVEAPSQMLEEWAWDPATLATFARHYQTHEPIPADLVRQMKRAKDYGEGLRTRRQMVYADLSLSCYDRPSKDADPEALMAVMVKKYQPFPFVEGTHFTCSFGHLDGYSAIYYTYMWSLVIAKDMFSQFDRNDMLASAVAKRYRNTVLAPGGSAPAAKLLENFLGRPFGFESYRRWLNQEDGKTSVN